LALPGKSTVFGGGLNLLWLSIVNTSVNQNKPGQKKQFKAKNFIKNSYFVKISRHLAD
jgi:hypothetical protein